MPLTPDQFETHADYREMKVCVTGGAGFIGSTLTHALADLGAKVRVIDDLSQGLESNLDGLGDNVKLIKGSILDPAALQQALDGVQVVFHQAALTSVPRSVAEPALYHEVNTTGTFRLLEAARKHGVRRIVAASSSSVYGEQAQSPKVETMRPDPKSPYAVSKITGEHLLSAWANCYDLSTIALRYFNIFGPHQRPDSPYAAVIPKFAIAMLQGKPMTIYGDGSQTRDFTHVSNAVHANLLAGLCDKPLKGEAINVATGATRTLSSVVEAMSEKLGVKPKLEYAPPRPGEVLHSHASIKLANELLGYEPIVSYEQGLEDALRYYKGE
ncbi:MAG: NAD-dependent epimerase/dehydratase family protein [Planctomycetota bacterium]|nr:NAD-dependent epimerase/dehydratase family protein [Planctomycetota bacterium]